MCLIVWCYFVWNHNINYDKLSINKKQLYNEILYNPNESGMWLIYDSQCMGESCLYDLKTVFAKLRPDLKESRLPFLVETVKFPVAQRQFGGRDCGPYVSLKIQPCLIST